MNIMRKPIKMEIEGKEYDFILDFESAMMFEDIYGKAILIGIDRITHNQELKALGCLIASCLKYKDKAVGMEFVNKIDFMNGLPFFVDKIGDLMKNSLPEEDDPDKKKQ
ncbi:hypothetical protein [Terrisporobacter sp.]|uniref:hypothetical protein n=1 Tax=Terrisporobacter sp. TaxID=1965305 RepID=UPI003995685F